MMPLITENTTCQNVMETLCEQGFDGMAQAFQILLNEAMKIQRSQFLNAQPYQRFDGRTDYANGFKDKSVKTRIGQLDLKVPQVRSSEFYPSALEKGIRSERALTLSLAEMYLQGVSTRKVKQITEALCGTEISSMDVSRASALLDEQIQAWRMRPLHVFPVVIVDALYEKVRVDHTVMDQAVLIAYGISPEGKREVLGTSVSQSEAEVHWRAFFQHLTERGLHGVELLVSDAHPGLTAARKAVFPSVPWQRCQFHLQQNAQKYISKQHRKSEVASDIRSIFNAPNLIEAQRLLQMAIEKYAKTEPKLAAWMEINIPEGFTVFARPEPQRKRVRTSNLAERVNKEIRRRTKIVGTFPNEKSALRLISAILMEIHEEWSSDSKSYLPFSA